MERVGNTGFSGEGLWLQRFIVLYNMHTNLV